MIKIHNLNKTYDVRSHNANHVLHDVSLNLPDKGFVCIVGPSGCGKTTLLNAIGGLDRFDNGTIETENISVSSYGTKAMEAERNQNFGYIFQNYYLLMDHSVGYNVYMGLHSCDMPEEEKLKRVLQALKSVGMEHYEKRIISELSGGQQQRVAIARALVKEPRVIFADEPTGNLDEANTLMICKCLKKLSKNSLIVMVTHEERIAKLFADRIIRLKDGYLVEDVSSWTKEGYTAEYDNCIYSMQYTEEKLQAQNGVNIRVLSAEGTEPVNLTVVVEKDRVVLKISDTRAILTGTVEDAPKLIEGKRPEVHDTDKDEENDLFATDFSEANKTVGKGLSFKFLHQEALRLSFKKLALRKNAVKSGAIKIFLVLLSVALLIITMDIYSIAKINPRDYTRVDSHAILVTATRGEALPADEARLFSDVKAWVQELKQNADFEILPRVNKRGSMTLELFQQFDSTHYSLSMLNYYPIDYLDATKLIYGRMPQAPDEIVIDVWLIDELMKEDGILQNYLSKMDYFLGKTISYPTISYKATIVGISDSGQPDLYIPRSGLASICVNGTDLMTLSELKKAYPGEYDSYELASQECIVNYAKAGSGYAKGDGTIFSKASRAYKIVDSIFSNEIYATMIIADEDLNEFLMEAACACSSFTFYSHDKEAVKNLIKTGDDGTGTQRLILTYVDTYANNYADYKEAASVKLNARAIIVVTVLALSLVMIYLFQKSRINERIGMVSVYRLLGVSNKKVLTIFALESFWVFVQSTLPATLGVWGILQILSSISIFYLDMTLPFWLMLLVALSILIYHLLVSVLPVLKLLKLPPAQLASKYDL